MRVIEIYETGRFPQLVLDSKKAFASNYGLSAEYWRHFDVQQSPEVLSYLKSNLKDLANHYHAQYQRQGRGGQQGSPTTPRRRAGIAQYIASFRDDAGTPAINYQLADLQLENQDYAGAAREYERTAYDYAKHERACRRRLCRDLRASRTSEGRQRDDQAHRTARHGRELAAIRRHVPGSRACGHDPRRGGRRSVRHERLHARAQPPVAS